MKLIVEHTSGIREEELEINSILCDSVLFRIIQISENTAKLSEEFKAGHPDVPWHAIKGMRNKIVHEYGYVDQGIIFDTVTEDIPKALRRLNDVANDFPSTEP